MWRIRTGGPNTSGLVACEQPEAKANLRPNTQTVLSTLSPRESEHCPSVASARLTSYDSRFYPFRSSLRSFVPRLSYLSNTSPPASPRSALRSPPPSSPRLSHSYSLPVSLPPCILLLTPFPYRPSLFFSFPYEPIRAGSLNPPVMARCIFLRRS